MVQLQAGTWYRRTPSTVHLLTGPRPLLDRRVLPDRRIRAVEGTEDVGLLPHSFLPDRLSRAEPDSPGRAHARGRQARAADTPEPPMWRESGGRSKENRRASET